MITERFFFSSKCAIDGGNLEGLLEGMTEEGNVKTLAFYSVTAKRSGNEDRHAFTSLLLIHPRGCYLFSTLGMWKNSACLSRFPISAEHQAAESTSNPLMAGGISYRPGCSSTPVHQQPTKTPSLSPNENFLVLVKQAV